ncbi:MAG: adenylate/guanylate cyclase domain-containing protein [Rhodospirillales bacterium]
MNGRVGERILRRLRLGLAVTVASAGGGAAYGFGIAGGELPGAARGAFVGAAIALLIVAFELFYVRTPAGDWVGRLSFARMLAAKSVIYFAVFALVQVAGAVIVPAGAEQTLRIGPEFATSMAFSAAFAVVINVVMQLNRLLGRGVLASFFIGRYHVPREEERIFLFLDLVGSTALAERLGGLRFMDLLNRLYRDIGAPIIECRGDIHKYVGDEVIVTWLPDKGLADANCVRCAFAVMDRIALLADAYQRSFGVTPRFRAGIHIGAVVSGELGDLKQEIAFLGDTMNTTARLIDACREHDRSCIASADLVARLSNAPEMIVEPLGSIHLRGRQAELELLALSPPDRARLQAAP